MQQTQRIGLLTLIGIAAAHHAAAGPVTYDYEIIADSRTNPLYRSLNMQARPTIGDNGTVVFSAQGEDGKVRVFRYADGVASIISNDGDGVSVSKKNQISPDGRVIAWMERDSSLPSTQTIIRRMTDGVYDLVYDVPGDPLIRDNVLAINDGRFAYAGSFFLTFVTPPASELTYNRTNNDLGNITGIPGINNAGDLAWFGQADSTPGTQIWINGSIVVPQTLYDPAMGNIDIDDSRRIAFTAIREPESLTGLYAYQDDTFSTLIEPWAGFRNGLVSNDEGGLSVNDIGDTALGCKPSADEPTGLWVVHADGSRSLVWENQSMLPDGSSLGQIVSRSFGPGGMNNAGQLVFDVQLVPVSSEEVTIIATPREACPADLAPPSGVLDLADVNAFVVGFTTASSIADLDNNGIFDLADIGLFVDSFMNGCP